MREWTVSGSVEYVLQMLPREQNEAAAVLAAVEEAFSHPGSQPIGWSGPTSYVFSHLRKQAPETRAAILAAARDTLQNRAGPAA
jgi:hypothetical protein